MLRAACQLRTPLHGSPLAPRCFCISQEKLSGSVLNSQYAIAHSSKGGVDRVEGRLPRPHFGMREKARLHIGVGGMPRLRRLDIRRLEDDQAPRHVAFGIEERSADSDAVRLLGVVEMRLARGETQFE